MSTNSNYITSPKGEIIFMALNRKVAKAMTEGSPEGYMIKLRFNSNNKDHAEFKAAIAAINPNLIGTRNIENKGDFTVRAFSLFAPEVVNGNGDAMEEIPNFYKDSKGTATMVVQPYTGNSLGGTITLAGVVIHELDSSETGADKNSLLDQLRGALKNAANN